MSAPSLANTTLANPPSGTSPAATTPSTTSSAQEEQDGWQDRSSTTTTSSATYVAEEDEEEEEEDAGNVADDEDSDAEPPRRRYREYEAARAREMAAMRREREALWEALAEREEVVRRQWADLRGLERTLAEERAEAARERREAAGREGAWERRWAMFVRVVRELREDLEWERMFH